MTDAAGVRATIDTYWHGNGPLWKIFWLWGVVGSWLLAAAFFTAARTFGVTWALYVVTAVVMVAYTAWILVSVWRCAANAGSEGIAVTARVLTIAWALNVVLVGAFLGLDLLGSTLG